MSLATELAERFSGPMAFRLVLQPVMAATLAILAGRRDACAGAPPYLWDLATHTGHRRVLLGELWRGVGRVLVLAIVMEIAYQLIVAGRLSLLETAGVSLLLAVAPYLVLRGLVNRLVRNRQDDRTRTG